MGFSRKTIEYKGQVVFEKISMPYFKRVPKEYEDHEACFIFVEEGDFSVRTPTEFLSFSKGKAMLAKCQDYFFETSKIQRESSEYFEVVGILLHQNIVEEIFQFDISDYDFALRFVAKELVVDSLLDNYRNSIDLLLENPELADEGMVRTKIKEFVLLISKKEKAPSHLHFLSALFNREEVRFKSTISRNMYSSLHVGELAKLCGMSLSSFKRQFKKIYGDPPSKYLNEMKLNKAAQMLRSGDLRVSDIAFDCGFDSLQTFNRNFKKQFFLSPSEYRQRQYA